MRTIISVVPFLFLLFAGGIEAAQWPPPGTASVRAFSFAGGPKDLVTKGKELRIPSTSGAEGLSGKIPNLSAIDTVHARLAGNSTRPRSTGRIG